jgi:hypothetical protein
MLRDARALVSRIMMRIELAGGAADVLAGFRGEALSLYFGDDPVFHFNACGELRRAFVDDRLIKAERGQLVVLVPDRTQERTELQATPLGNHSQCRLLAVIESQLRELDAVLSANRFVVLGQQPSEGNVLDTLQRWLAVRSGIRVANSPRVGG